MNAPKLPPTPADPKTPELAYVALTLPSRGVLYGPHAPIPTPPLPGGVVHIRKMLIQEGEILASAGGTMLTKLSKILARVLKLPDGFDPECLLPEDRVYALIALRAHTYGPVHEISFNCPHCGAKARKAKVDVVQDLNEIPLPEDFIEPVDVYLPDAKVRVGLRLFRGQDEQDLLKLAKAAEQRGLTATPVQDQLRLLIVTIDGEKAEPLAKMDLIRRLTESDVMATRKAMPEFGIDTSVSPTCDRCETPVQMDIPFGADFLRPAAR